VRTWSARDLLVYQGTTTGNNNLQETALYGLYHLRNYADPRTRVDQITFKSLRPDDSRAAATWDLMTTVDISDVVELTVTNPGGGGFSSEPFYVEGISYEVGPLTPDYQDVTLTLDVSPAAYFLEDVFV